VPNFGKRRSEMNPINAVDLASLIQVYYPGGVDNFKKAGGSVFSFPKEERYIIYCKELPESFCLKIKQLTSKNKIHVEFYVTGNFEGKTLDEVREWILNFSTFIMKNSIRTSLTTITPCTIYTCVENVRSDNTDIKQLLDYLNSSKEIVRAHIECEDKMLEINKNKDMSKMRIDIQPEHKPITDDDVLNLRIALETSNTVEELLAQI
jgi:hypothetical protein